VFQCRSRRNHKKIKAHCWGFMLAIASAMPAAQYIRRSANNHAAIPAAKKMSEVWPAQTVYRLFGLASAKAATSAAPKLARLESRDRFQIIRFMIATTTASAISCSTVQQALAAGQLRAASGAKNAADCGG